jgi:hypothetical protein
MTLEERRKRAENALMKYHSRRESGVCVACGQNPPVEGVLRCAGCRKVRKATSQKQKYNRPEGNCRQCLTRKAVQGITSCSVCRERGRKKSKAQHRDVRIRVITRYGGRCTCCGTSNYKYLQLDHKNDDGNVERKALPPSIRGSRYFKMVLSQPKRDDLHLLCANCHNAKRYGGCTPEDHPLRMRDER